MVLHSSDTNPLHLKTTGTISGRRQPRNGPTQQLNIWITGEFSTHPCAQLNGGDMLWPDQLTLQAKQLHF
jgi:hypothetical protein